MAENTTPTVDGVPVPQQGGTAQNIPNQPAQVTPQDTTQTPTENTPFNAIVQKGTVRQIRDLNLYMEIVFYNQIKNQKPLYLPMFYVDSLIINETIHNWVTTAEITINNPFEAFSRGATGNPNNVKTTVDPLYIDRTDGRNRVMIKIYPTDSKGAYGPGSKIDLPREYYEICYDFVVSETEDVEVSNNQVKKRKYKLIDERFQILYERNLEWSTAIMAAYEKQNRTPIDPNAEGTGVTKINAYDLTDDQASLNPNYVLRKFLEVAANNKIGDFSSYSSSIIAAELNKKQSAVSRDVVKVGYTDSGSIENPTIPLYNYDDKLWDAGDESNKFKHTSPANNTGLDDLYFILSHCKGKDGTPVILKFGRTTDDKKWKLYSLKYLFDRCEQLQIERIFIEDGVENPSTYFPRGPIFQSPTTYLNMSSIIASRIQSYRFNPMSAIDSNRILNSPNHFFDFQLKKFFINFEKNTVSNLVNILNTIAAKLYSSKTSKHNPHVLLNVNKTKYTGISTENKTSYNGKFSPPDGPLMELIKDAVFLNQTVTFTCMGLTLRTPGKFLLIDKVSLADKPNAFDDRFFGQWLITNVVHRFENTSYLTDITAVKIDTFSKIFDVIDQHNL